MKLKSITTMVILTSALSISSSYASCLDFTPTTKAAVAKELRKARTEYNNLLEQEHMYKALADSAKNRSLIAMSVGAVSLAPLAIYYGAPAILVGSITSDAGMLVAAIPSVIGEAGLATKTFVELVEEYDLNQNDPSYYVPMGTCSYAQVQEKLDANRKTILDEKFDGSLKNMVIDHVTLGNLSSKATGKLYEIAHLKSIVGEAKVRELKLISQDLNR